MQVTLNAMRSWGWVLGVAGFFLALVALIVISQAAGPSAVEPLGIKTTTETKVVPAIGEQGFNTEVFCNDSLTTAAKDLVAPPDSTYVVTYHLERVKDGIHEIVTIGTYADPSRQPTATHYDSANVPIDAWVSKEALACITKKAAQ
jgi:hypothetical protein